ncbi:hypothetical protein GCM10009863_09190 [Streptomyces axinellae]|uniref:Uncharacterized protein n=1 Tax=Streptomyces axinellae TaxID=552788 RepID=A0ABN3PR57_9ACTN
MVAEFGVGKPAALGVGGAAGQPQSVEAVKRGGAPGCGRCLRTISRTPLGQDLQDLAFHCPDPKARYRHIDPLFSTGSRTAIDCDPMAREGWTPQVSDLAVPSPYQRENVLRFAARRGEKNSSIHRLRCGAEQLGSRSKY